MAEWRGGLYWRKRKGTWRDRNTGITYTRDGRPIAREITSAHYYSKDVGRTAHPIRRSMISSKRARSFRRRK